MVDLGKFRGIGPGGRTDTSRPTDPEAIFRRAPKGAESFADLWRGQTDALRGWAGRRDQADVLISLNTGAGKTVAGLLIAQSFVNEGLEYVVYACGTIDLVNQTAKEAMRLGVEPTLRVQQKFSDNRFETGKAFCITTYQALYQPFSQFRTKFVPQAIIFDDAHTSEGYLRDAFTLPIDRKSYEDSYVELMRLFAPAFQEIGKLELFNEIQGGESQATLLVPPFYIHQKAPEITAFLRPLRKNKDDTGFAYRWGMLSEHIHQCAVVVSNSAVEFSPPFLPIRTLPYFERDDMRRVYTLSDNQLQVGLDPLLWAGNPQRKYHFPEE